MAAINQGFDLQTILDLVSRQWQFLNLMDMLTAFIQATWKRQQNTSMDWDNETIEATAQGNRAHDKT